MIFSSSLLAAVSGAISCGSGDGGEGEEERAGKRIQAPLNSISSVLTGREEEDEGKKEKVFPSSAEIVKVVGSKEGGLLITDSESDQVLLEVLRDLDGEGVTSRSAYFSTGSDLSLPPPPPPPPEDDEQLEGDEDSVDSRLAQLRLKYCF